MPATRWRIRCVPLCAALGMMLGAGCETLNHSLTPADKSIPAPSIAHYYGLKPKAAFSANPIVQASAIEETKRIPTNEPPGISRWGVKPGRSTGINPVARSANEVQPVSNTSTPSIASPEFPIDLGIALRLAGASNPTIALAQEQIREALADQLAAKSLLLPTLNLGGNYHIHTGPLQGGAGTIRTPDSQNFFVGAGAYAVGGGTVAIPGARLFAHLGDAFYEPLAAQQHVSATRSDSIAMQNAILRDVATAYLELIGAESRLAILRQADSELTEIVRLTEVYAKKGQGLSSDAHRAGANAELLKQDVRRGEEDLAVASARLGRFLSLDPTLKLRTPGGAVEPIRLMPEESELESLVASAVLARPEIFARSAEIMEAEVRMRQERVRPWVPTLSVGYSYGLFGGGSNQVQPMSGPTSSRSDLDVTAVWSFENLGLGNHARVKRANSGVGQAVSEYELAMNRVRREVADALAGVKAASRQIEIAKTALVTAEEGFALERQRIQQGQGRPIEVLDSFRQAVESRQELLRAMVAFNISQFQLFTAVGKTPTP